MHRWHPYDLCTRLTIVPVCPVPNQSKRCPVCPTQRIKVQNGHTTGRVVVCPLPCAVIAASENATALVIVIYSHYLKSQAARNMYLSV